VREILNIAAYFLQYAKCALGVPPNGKINNTPDYVFENEFYGIEEYFHL
jgi:hypothetical protein